MKTLLKTIPTKDTILGSLTWHFSPQIFPKNINLHICIYNYDRPYPGKIIHGFPFVRHYHVPSVALRWMRSECLSFQNDSIYLYDSTRYSCNIWMLVTYYLIFHCSKPKIGKHWFMYTWNDEAIWSQIWKETFNKKEHHFMLQKHCNPFGHLGLE